MSINDSYYKNKTKLKKFHISLLMCFILFFILFILVYFGFFILYDIFFCVTFLSILHTFYRGNVFYNHMKNKMEEKKKKGIKPAFDIDIIED